MPTRKQRTTYRDVGTEDGPAPQLGGTESQLALLADHLRRCRRRSRRLHRLYRQSEGQQSWQRWSDAVRDVELTRERIATIAPRSIEGLAVRYLALASMLLDDDVVVDEVARREVVRFGTALGRLTSPATR